MSLLYYSHSIATFCYQDAQSQYFTSVTHVDGDLKVVWSQKLGLGYNKHTIRNDAKWLVHIYADDSRSYFHSYCLNGNWRSDIYHLRTLHLGDMGHDSCCEFLGSVCYMFNRKINRLNGSSQSVVSYYGAAMGDDENERNSLRVDIPHAFVVDGTVDIAEMSLQQDPQTGSPVLIDVIGVQIAGCAKQHENMQWLCFSQGLNRSPLGRMLDGPALLLYVGPMCEAPSQKCHTSAQAGIPGGTYSQRKIQTRNAHSRRYPRAVRPFYQ
ncbi:uncharacterized protein N7498_007890 [Penicillium cinerascens]|uniref:Uncharacterized protein n=1 Tax=Penicillium cinerascens TaxID=70096 RepID=A0A9W9ME94_9EURO|nr:uncharacterized protein N7498_007890 [Penicillium cinerascens]KAJ5198773.1 hypothetical protein N7498_007890 [Penicillium cinerascens]